MGSLLDGATFKEKEYMNGRSEVAVKQTHMKDLRFCVDTMLSVSEGSVVAVRWSS